MEEIYIDVIIDSHSSNPDRAMTHVQNRLMTSLDGMKGASVLMVFRDKNDRVIKHVVEGPLTQGLKRRLEEAGDPLPSSPAV